jgi:GH3 auxin-responsive promoter
MSLKAIVAKIFAKKIHYQTQKWATNPIETQQKVFAYLMRQAKKTQFGTDHNFEKIKTFEDFVKQVPIRDYVLVVHN